MRYDDEFENDQDRDVQLTLKTYGLKETIELLTIMEIDIETLNGKTKTMFNKAYEKQLKNINGDLDGKCSGHKYDYDYELSE